MCQVNYKTVRTEKAFKIFRFLREYNRFSLIRFWCSFFLQLLGHKVHLNVLGSEKISIKRRYGKESQKNTKFKTLANRGGGGVLPAIVFQNLSWTPKTCFAFSLDCLLFISSILDDFESNPMFIYVGSSLNMSNIDILFPQTFSKDIATIFE